MRLRDFARLVDAPPKWVQNAAGVLDIRLNYTIAEAQHLALARSISETAGIPLKGSFRLAGAALSDAADLFVPLATREKHDRRVRLAESPDGAVTIHLDLVRFASAFVARLAACDLSGEEARDRATELQRPSASLLGMLQGLAAAEIRFVVIGGLGAASHGSAIVTADLNICYDSANDNVEPLAAVLRAWKAYPRGIEDSLPFLMDAKQLRVAPVMRLTTVLGDIDVTNAVAGIGGYDEVHASSRTTSHGELEFQVLRLGR